MNAQVQLGDIAVDVVRKNIKNVHLSVHPPTGNVRIAAPARMELDVIRVFAISKLSWIRQQQQKFREQERETPREYLDRESHYFWGRRYLLTVEERSCAPSVEASHLHLVMRVRPGASPAKRQAILEEWYRRQLKEAVPPLLAKWEGFMGIKAGRVFIQQMKTLWGSCNHRTGTIRLNTELAKKPRKCLEYVIVHELVHLLEPTHNARFITLIDRFMPRWQSHRHVLNRMPVRHETWNY